MKNIRQISQIFFPSLLLMVSCTDIDRVAIGRDDFADKVRGAWAGKLIGVQYGQSYEFMSLAHINEGEMEWSPEMILGALAQDDVYTQVSFMQTIAKEGLDASADRLAEDFATAGFELFHANLQARKNWYDGLRPPLTGSARYNAHANDIDFQIDADFIGLMCPGMPDMVSGYCDRIGTIMNDGDGIYGGVFIATMHCLGFFHSDMASIVEGALANIPAGSSYARCISDVLECYRTDPSDWRKAWDMLHARWEDHICIPNIPFNIDARMNGAYVAIALLYGGEDFARTMEIAVRCGQDSDCNASNAAAIWGVVHGYSAIPSEYSDALSLLGDKPFSYTEFSYEDVVSKTMEFARTNIVRGGGSVGTDEYRVRCRKPAFRGDCRQSFPGMTYVRSHGVEDSAWSYCGEWKHIAGWGEDVLVESSEAGASATLVFEGEMIVLTGLWGPESGMADVFLDEVHVRRIDAWWSYECGFFAFNRQVLFVASGLDPGKHTLRIAIVPERNPSSTGSRVSLLCADVYAGG